MNNEHRPNKYLQGRAIKALVDRGVTLNNTMMIC